MNITKNKKNIYNW